MKTSAVHVSLHSTLENYWKSQLFDYHRTRSQLSNHTSKPTHLETKRNSLEFYERGITVHQRQPRSRTLLQKERVDSTKKVYVCGLSQKHYGLEIDN